MVEGNADDVDLSVNQVRKIGHKLTRNERISKDAATRVALEEERRIMEIFRLSEKVAKIAGRKTVKEEDVRLVYEVMESDI